MLALQTRGDTGQVGDTAPLWLGIVSMEPLLRCLGCQNREKNSFVPARSEKRLIPEPY